MGIRRAIFDGKTALWVGLLLLCGSTAQADTWESSGLAGQSVFALTRDTAGTLYAGTFGLLYASLDTGQTWAERPALPPGSADVFGLAVNPVTNHLFAVTEPGVFRSDDGGLSWEFLHEDLVGGYHIAVRGDGRLAVTGSSGTYQSTDNGSTWELVHAVSAGTTIGDGLGLLPSGAFVALNHDGLFRSSGEGQIWSEISTVRDSGAMVSSFAIDRVHNILYRADHRVIDSLFRVGYVIYRSFNHGDSWQRVDSGKYSIPDPLFVDSRGVVWTYRLVGLGLPDLLQSADSGATWTSASDGMPGEAGALCFLQFSQGLLFAGTVDHGLYRLAFSGGQCCVLAGDANNDSKVNASDVITLVNFVFKAGPGLVCAAQGDANGDAKLTSADIILAVNFIFKSGTPLGCGSGN